MPSHVDAQLIGPPSSLSSERVLATMCHFNHWDEAWIETGYVYTL